MLHSWIYVILTFLCTSKQIVIKVMVWSTDTLNVEFGPLSKGCHLWGMFLFAGFKTSGDSNHFGPLNCLYHKCGSKIITWHYLNGAWWCAGAWWCVGAWWCLLVWRWCLRVRVVNDYADVQPPLRPSWEKSSKPLVFRHANQNTRPHTMRRTTWRK